MVKRQTKFRELFLVDSSYLKDPKSSSKLPMENKFPYQNPYDRHPLMTVGSALPFDVEGRSNRSMAQNPENYQNVELNNATAQLFDDSIRINNNNGVQNENFDPVQYEAQQEHLQNEIPLDLPRGLKDSSIQTENVMFHDASNQTYLPSQNMVHVSSTQKLKKPSSKKSSLKAKRHYMGYKNFKNIVNWKRKFFCSICDLHFKSYEALINHINSLHRNQNVSFLSQNNYRLAAVDVEKELNPIYQNLNQDQESQVIGGKDHDMVDILDQRDQGLIGQDLNTQAAINHYSNYKTKNKKPSLKIKSSLASVGRFKDNRNVMAAKSLLKVRDAYKAANFEDSRNIAKSLLKVRDDYKAANFEDSRNIANWKKQYFCMICEMEFMSYEELSHHLQNNHEDGSYTINFPYNQKYAAVAVESTESKNQIVNTALNQDLTEGLDQFNQDQNISDVAEEKQDTNEKLKLNKDTTSHLNFLDNTNIMGPQEITRVEDLQTFKCTKCTQIFRNFESLDNHLQKDHNQPELIAKRSKTKDKVKRRVPDYYSNY